MKEFVFEVSVEATRTFRVYAKNRKEAIKTIIANNDNHEIDYLLGSFDEENQIQREWIN